MALRLHGKALIIVIAVAVAIAVGLFSSVAGQLITGVLVFGTILVAGWAGSTKWARP